MKKKELHQKIEALENALKNADARNEIYKKHHKMIFEELNIKAVNETPEGIVIEYHEPKMHLVDINMNLDILRNIVHSRSGESFDLGNDYEGTIDMQFRVSDLNPDHFHEGLKNYLLAEFDEVELNGFYNKVIK